MKARLAGVAVVLIAFIALPAASAQALPAPVAVICGANDSTPQSWDINQPVTFDGNCSHDSAGDPLTYQWDFDYNGTAFNPTFVAGYPDTNGLIVKSDGYNFYTADRNGNPLAGVSPTRACLRVVDDFEFGASDMACEDVIIKPPPHAPHVVVQRAVAGVVNQPVQFDASQSDDVDNDPLTYAWDFHDNGLFADATGANPAFTWSSPGTYNVAVAVTDHPELNPVPYNACPNGQCSAPYVPPNGDATTVADITVTITNTSVPVASAGGPYTGLSGSTIALDASGSSDPDASPLTYAWDFSNDGNYTDATGAKPAFTIPNAAVPGTRYHVCVKVTNQAGGSASACAPVTVVSQESPPTCSIATPNVVKANTASNQTITIDGSRSSDSNGNALTYSWTTTGPVTIDQPMASAINETGNFAHAGRSVSWPTTLAVSNGYFTSSCNATVSIVDSLPPRLTLPPDAIFEASANTSSEVSAWLAQATASDDAASPGTAIPISNDFTPNSGIGGVGVGNTVKVTWTAQNPYDSSTTSQKSATVTVRDTTPPALSLSTDVTTDATGAAGAVVSFSASASDFVSGNVPTTCTPASGSTFPLGTTTVACQATDGAGNTATGSFKVTVRPSASFVRQFGSGGGGNGQLAGAAGLAVDPSTANVIVADDSSERIDVFDSSGNFVKAWGAGVADGSSSSYQTCDKNTACHQGVASGSAGGLNRPKGVAVDSAGNVFVADSSNNRVDEFDSSGGFVRAWGWGVIPGQAAAFQTCTTASGCQAGSANGGEGAGTLAGPYGVAVGPSGDVFVAEYRTSRISVFDPSSATVKFLSSWGWGVSDQQQQFEICTSGCHSGRSGTGAGGQGGSFDGLTGITIDPASGDVYALDSLNYRVQQFHASGAFVQTWGWGVADGQSQLEACTSKAAAQPPGCLPGLFGHGGAGQFANPIAEPVGIAVDATGNVDAVDQDNNRVQQFTPGGGFQNMFGYGVLDGRSAFENCQNPSPTTNPCEPGQEIETGGGLFLPTGIAADAKGDLYVDNGDSIEQYSVPVAQLTPPTGLNASPAGTSEIDLSWTAVSGATAYKILRATATGGPYIEIASTTTTATYNDTGVTPGTTYYYVVQAAAGPGSSANSAEANATTNPAESTLTVTKSGNGSGSVTSSPSGINCGSTCSAQFPTGTQVTLTATPSLGSTFTGWSGGGCSGTGSCQITLTATTNVTATFTLTAPGAPTGLTASAFSSSEIHLSWDSTQGASGYRVLRGSSSGGPYAQVATPSGTTFADTGLNASTTYYYVVQSTNAGGSSPNSGEASATTTPAAPRGVVASGVSSSEIDLSWDPAQGASDYRVLRGTSSGGPYAPVGAPSGTSFADTGLRASTTYYYVVQATNVGGPSAESSEVSASTEAGCVAAAGIDVPDPSFTDSNCDGIDGDRSRAVFVSPTGNDTNNGTISAPKRTIAVAVKTAEGNGKSQILVADGTYDEKSPVDITSGLGVYGGYDPSTWQRAASEPTITGKPAGIVVEAPHANVELQFLHVTGSANGLGSGASSYGVRAVGGSLTISHSTVTADDGVAGAAGANGRDPATLAAALGLRQFPDMGASGQSGAVLDCGGGSIPGQSLYCSSWFTTPPAPPVTFPRYGLDGGGGGTDTQGLAGFAGGGPADFGNGLSVAMGGPGGSIDLPGLPGFPGVPGLSGSSGASGTNSTALAGPLWVGEPGGDGGPGQPGQGGGGGGAGGTYIQNSGLGGVQLFTGGGGGGGGQGGLGGEGGKGGQPGGGSFAVYLDGTAATIIDSTLVSGKGGPGGPGGAPGSGGPGGQGGLGGIVPFGNNGGPGGGGGGGGPGGPGGAGAGGPSAAIFKIAGASASVDVASTLNGGSSGPAGASGRLGTAGAPGKSGTCGTKLCLSVSPPKSAVSTGPQPQAVSNAGTTTLTLSCQGAGTCQGQVLIVSGLPPSVAGTAAKRKPKRPKTILIAAATYTVRQGHHVRLVLRLTSNARKLLLPGHTLRATLIITSRDRHGTHIPRMSTVRLRRL